ncbi:MAG: ABC transporter permease [Alphaproteobacteria bacterium]|nr:ABC transporter permease [Alphaproteobacteria bacterium]
MSAAAEDVRARPVPRSARRQAADAFLRDRMAVAGLIVLVLAHAAAILAPALTRWDPTIGDEDGILVPPFSPGHVLGTDEQGRDILARILFGARLAFPEAVVPVVAAGAAGLVLGLIGGFFQRVIGEAVMRTLDVLFAIPMVLLAIAIATTLGSGLPTVILSMAIVITPYIARVVATTAAQQRSAPFVEAARCAGFSEWKILRREILPHVIPAVVVYGTTNMGAMVVFAAGFGFLGLGAQPPTPDWGAMISGGMRSLASAPWVSTVPGIAIVVISLAFNYVGDGLRVALDPRLRTRL